jgi:hypothetical protein
VIYGGQTPYRNDQVEAPSIFATDDYLDIKYTQRAIVTEIGPTSKNPPASCTVVATMSTFLSLGTAVGRYTLKTRSSRRRASRIAL